jgi:hypothetical protein
VKATQCPLWAKSGHSGIHRISLRYGEFRSWNLIDRKCVTTVINAPCDSDELLCTALISSPLSKHWAQLEPGNAKSNVDCD